MKKVLLVFTLFLQFLSFSQKTVQFSDPLPFGSPSQLTTDKTHFGKYKSSDSQVTYVIDEKGISIVTVAIASITREQVRESSKLQVKIHQKTIAGVAHSTRLQSVKRLLSQCV